MYLDNLSMLAVMIALVSALATALVGVISARQWEKLYRDTYRALNQERQARAYWQEHKEISK